MGCVCGCFCFFPEWFLYQGTCGWVQESHVHHPRWSYHVVHRHSSESTRWIDIHTLTVVGIAKGRGEGLIPRNAQRRCSPFDPLAGLLNMDSNSQFVEHLKGWPRYIPFQKVPAGKGYVIVPWRVYYIQHVGATWHIGTWWYYYDRNVMFLRIKKAMENHVSEQKTHTSTFMDVRLQKGHLLYWSSCLFRSLWPKLLSKMYCEDVCGKGKA